MRKLILRLLPLAAMLCGSLPAAAQTTLVRNGKPAARIVVADDAPANLRAATLLQRFVREASGATLPLLEGAAPRRGDM